MIKTEDCMTVPESLHVKSYGLRLGDMYLSHPLGEGSLPLDFLVVSEIHVEQYQVDISLQRVQTLSPQLLLFCLRLSFDYLITNIVTMIHKYLLINNNFIWLCNHLNTSFNHLYIIIGERGGGELCYMQYWDNS